MSSEKERLQIELFNTYLNKTIDEFASQAHLQTGIPIVFIQEVPKAKQLRWVFGARHFEFDSHVRVSKCTQFVPKRA
jgi:hypothetical protein